MIFPPKYYVIMFAIISLSLEIGRVPVYAMHIHVVHGYFIIYSYMLYIIYVDLICLLDLALSQPQGRGLRAILRGKLIGVLMPIDLLFSGCSRVSVEAPSDKDVDSHLFCG